jgi:hypothetical protein
MLSTHYDPRRGQDYKAFVMLPVPWPQRGAGTDYVKGAIHISFRTDGDFEVIWPKHAPARVGPGPAPAKDAAAPVKDDFLLLIALNQLAAPAEHAAAPAKPARDPAEYDPARNPNGDDPKYRFYLEPERMLEDRCDPEVRAALRNSMAVLAELLRGFNETIYRNWVEPYQAD